MSPRAKPQPLFGVDPPKVNVVEAGGAPPPVAPMLAYCLPLLVPNAWPNGVDPVSVADDATENVCASELIVAVGNATGPKPRPPAKAPVDPFTVHDA